jgi:hypothetical protein
LADAGMSAMQVATALGHASSRTSERYCHIVGDAHVVLAQRVSDCVQCEAHAAVPAPVPR